MPRPKDTIVLEGLTLRQRRARVEALREFYTTHPVDTPFNQMGLAITSGEDIGPAHNPEGTSTVLLAKVAKLFGR